jgi:hypothetical protein
MNPSPSRSRFQTRFRGVVVGTLLAAAVFTAIAIGATDRGVTGASRMASVAPPRVLQPLGHLEIRLPGVSSISANRDVVAVAVERPEKCGKVLLWAPRSRRISAIAGGCSAANGYNSISDLVLGRTVVAWVFSWGDRDSGSDCLMIRQVSTARIGRAITRKKHACNADYYGGFGGDEPFPRSSPSRTVEQQAPKATY